MRVRYRDSGGRIVRRCRSRVRRPHGPAQLDQERGVRRRVLRRLGGLLHRRRLRLGHPRARTRRPAPPSSSRAAPTSALSDAVSIGSVVASEGAPLKIIGTTYQKNPFTILSLADGGDIATPEDLDRQEDRRPGLEHRRCSRRCSRPTTSTESELTIVPVQYDPAPLDQRRGRRLHRLPDERVDHGRGIGRRDDQPAVRRQRPAVRRRDHHGDRRRDRERPREAQGVPGRRDQGLDRGRATTPRPARSSPSRTTARTSTSTSRTPSPVRPSRPRPSWSPTRPPRTACSRSARRCSRATIKSLAGAGITLEASDLFDLSLLAEVYEENPDLIAYAG